MRAVIATFVACLLIVSAFYVSAGGFAAGTPEGTGDWTPYDTMEMLKSLKENSVRDGEEISRSNIGFDTFSFEDGPYPNFKDDGSLYGMEPIWKDWGDNYVSEVMYRPPNNPGGGYSMDATGGAGPFGAGGTHESFIGDQNGDGVLEWVVYYSYKTYGEDGIDNDGDGCIDEKTYGDWDGQAGCDLIPDQFTYFGTGGLADVGGKDGTLAVFADWYNVTPTINFYRIFVTPLWTSFSMSWMTYYPQLAEGEDVISFYAHESHNQVNANPEMDSDMDDYYVGSMDARGFPTVSPTIHVCFAGYQLYMGVTYARDDDYVVTSFELREEYDDHDWNGDGDKDDPVAAYYVVDPSTGECDQGVNGGVSGWYPRNSGRVMTPGYTFESSDSRDWNGDGDTSDTVLLWHDINSTWSLVGHRYTSVTFTSSPGAFGFGFWGRYSDYGQFQTFPLEFGGTYYRYVGRPGYYKTSFFLIDDEDGDPQTILPYYDVYYGMPSGTLGGICIQIYGMEYHLKDAGIELMGGKADGNGDGDTSDSLGGIFCPDEKGGGGKWWVEPTSKFAKGLYKDVAPWIWTGYTYYASTGEAQGLMANTIFYMETYIDDDADGNLVVELIYYHAYYWIGKEDAKLLIVDASWVGDDNVQPGGTVIGKISFRNYGSSALYVSEDAVVVSIYKTHRIQGLYLDEELGPDGFLEPGEIGTVYFAMRLSAGVPIGPLTLTIHVAHGVTLIGTDLTLSVSLKMFGNEMSCYRHRQNALRAIRAFDMDDDKGRLHNLIQGKYVNMAKYGLGKMEPEEALFQLILWYEEGCKVKGGVELAHSVGMKLTGKYGMGISFWGLNPGQEDGNEGNGNGGLSGIGRKDIYGF